MTWFGRGLDGSPDLQTKDSRSGNFVGSDG